MNIHHLLWFVALGCLPLLAMLSYSQASPASAQSPSPIREFTVGVSGQGRPILVTQIGHGPRKLVVVSNTHGAPEANTYTLALELLDHFRAHPAEVPAEVRLYIIPTINPDGLALGTRLNAFGVDLNRNMNTNLDACPANDWSHTVYGAYGMISDSGGWYPDSQRETQLLRSFLLDANGAIFLHSNAGLVFPAFCEHAPSNAMAEIYAKASGYRYERYWDAYTITGSMADWASSIGIAAITPELFSPTASEFSQNLAGIRAVLAHAATILPPLQPQQVGAFEVPAILWRYWRTHGGEAVFGFPLEPARITPDGYTQTFTNARLEIRQAHRDTPLFVQLAPLGTSYWPLPPSSATPPLAAVFQEYWERHGGAAVFGHPISEAHEQLASDGQRRVHQYFERMVLSYAPEHARVHPEPLGWQTLLRETIQANWVASQIR